MKIAFLALIPVAVAAQPVEIPAEIVESCKQHGCIIVMPEGHVIPKPLMDEAIKKIQIEAFQKGQATCKRKDV